MLINHIEGCGVYVDPFESVLEFNLPDGHPINIIDGINGVKADVYVARDTGLYVFAMQRRRRLRFYESPPLDAWFLSPEDVILYKLDYFRQSEGVSQKHPLDIARMLSLHSDTLDLAYLEEWARTIGVSDLWQALWAQFQGSRRR